VLAGAVLAIGLERGLFCPDGLLHLTLFNAARRNAVNQHTRRPVGAGRWRAHVEQLSEKSAAACPFDRQVDLLMIAIPAIKTCPPFPQPGRFSDPAGVMGQG